MTGESASSEIECTAFGTDDGDGRNILEIPPCGCPRCTAKLLRAEDPDRNWLRVSGRSQRYRVEPAELGPLGKTVLG
ncbi:MAG: hypothetical protein IT196_09595 [Acidimicrobiales bacterium]|nr:hypothetical protein [Acidimicrobiales bacterium]